MDLAVPKLRSGTYRPEELFEPRRGPSALAAVVAWCCVEGVSTRRVDDVVRAVGIEAIAESRASEVACSLDAAVEALRNRPLDEVPLSQRGVAFWASGQYVFC